MSRAIAVNQPSARARATPMPENRRKFWSWTLLAIGVVGVVGSGLAAYFIYGAQNSDRLVSIRLGAVSLQTPAALIRPGPQREGGDLPRLDLALDFADFGPARLRSPAKADADARLDQVLLVALTKPDTIGDPAGRLGELYGRFLEPDLAAGPAGLMMRRFRTSSPYAGEALFFAPPDGRLFWARCPAASEPVLQALAPVCLTELRREGLDLQLRFDPGQLEHWARTEAALSARLAEWRR